MMRIDNRSTSAANPLTFEAYGAGARPVFRGVGIYAFEFGDWQNTVLDGGYVFRAIKFDGLGAGQWGFWLRGRVSGVLFEDVEITGWGIGIKSQGHDPVSNITVRNSDISRNRGMGMLGTYNESLIENNTFNGNNFSGSALEHAIYTSDSTGLTIRGNTFTNNSVVNGTCTGGTLTIHGQNDRLLIEGNKLNIANPIPACWPISITAKYTSPEWFRNTIVRNNTITNFALASISYNAAPGIVIEGNTICKPDTSTVLGINRDNELGAGDDPGGNEVIRNNVRRSGVDAVTGPCAP